MICLKELKFSSAHNMIWSCYVVHTLESKNQKTDKGPKARDNKNYLSCSFRKKPGNVNTVQEVRKCESGRS